ncbi:hypothetical protein C0431_14405 [bacterium]|nr:hypothetical protein [bacterium]
MVATLSKNTAGTSWSLGNERSHDVWGSVRSGAATDGPKSRYVANLGHVQDDESGLIYMRARYYESESGRFLSEDCARQAANWYSYCKNDPNNYVDESGNSYEIIHHVIVSALQTIGLFTMFAGFSVFIFSGKNLKAAEIGLKTMLAGLWMIEAGFAYGNFLGNEASLASFVMSGWVTRWLVSAVALCKTAETLPGANKYAFGAMGYGLVLVFLTLGAFYGE